MAIKIILAIMLILMAFNLFKAMKAMLNGDPKVSMSKYIGRRVMFSAAIIILMIVAVMLGWITPNPRPY